MPIDPVVGQDRARMPGQAHEPLIISVGSINADFVYRLDDDPPTSGAVVTRDVFRTSGGKAANVAVIARRLGVEARLVGCVGSDELATQALRGPRQAGVDLSSVRTVSGNTSVSTILVPPSGQKVIVLALGANASDDWGSVAGAFEGVVAPAVLVVDLEVPSRVVAEAVELAHDAGITVVLDPAPASAITDHLLTIADHVTPDPREAEQLTGITIDDVDDARRAVDALRRRGTRNAYVKLAGGGCVVAWEDGDTVVSAPDVRVVDATGAGDAFAGALAWACLSTTDPRVAAVAGVAAATCAVQHLGSQESYPSLEQLQAMIERVESLRN